MARLSLYVLSLVIAWASTNRNVEGQGTRVGFYGNSCLRVEDIVRETVERYFNSDPTIAPGLLRMHFHDCFVNGCDGSVLINGTNTEKTALPNLSLKGFEVIDDAKKALEGACPNTVSCADILALAARDSVFLTSGRSVTWAVPLGRKDGTVSLASNTSDLPGFNEPVDAQRQKFAAKGLNDQDLVTLVGGHTIGTAACQVFSYRLYNFTANGPDPTINSTFLAQLRALCPQNGDGTRRVVLDAGSGSSFDTSFFANLQNQRGVLESDQKLYTDPSTKTIVDSFAGPIRGVLGLRFNDEFGRSMVKMGNIGVKTGTDGEIRRVCSAVN